MKTFIKLSVVLFALTGSAVFAESPAETYGKAQLQAWKDRALAQRFAPESKMYPVNKRVQITDTIIRPCTKLEAAAGVPEEDCGQLPLGEVVSMYFEIEDDRK